MSVGSMVMWRCGKMTDARGWSALPTPQTSFLEGLDDGVGGSGWDCCVSAIGPGTRLVS